MPDARQNFIANGGMIAVIVFLIIGVVASANFTLNATFQKQTVINESYNPTAEPVYQEVCDYSYGAGETCGEKLLNELDFKREIVYRTFILDGLSKVMVGHNLWAEDDMINPQLVYLGFYSGLAWLGWKRITRNGRLGTDTD